MFPEAVRFDPALAGGGPELRGGPGFCAFSFAVDVSLKSDGLRPSSLAAWIMAAELVALTSASNVFRNSCSFFSL